MSDVCLLLKEARESSGLSLEEVAQRTYIKLPYLEALEEGQLERLPAPVYTYGYIRQVAKVLGLDGGALVQRFQEQERGGSARAGYPPQRSDAPMADMPGDSMRRYKPVYPTSNGRNGHDLFAPVEGESGDVRTAKQQAEQILAAAEREAQQLIRGAEQYASEVLGQLEDEVARSLQIIQNGRQYLASQRGPRGF